MKPVIKERLVEARVNRGVSQQWLAEKIGCSRPTIQRWENANSSSEPNATELKKLAEALEVSVAWLVGEKNDSAAIDLSALLTGLEKNDPEVVVLLRSTEASWHKMSSEAQQSITEGLRYVLGRARLEDMQHLKKPKRGDI